MNTLIGHTKATMYAASVWLVEDPRRLGAVAAAITAALTAITLLSNLGPNPVLVAPGATGGGGGTG